MTQSSPISLRALDWAVVNWSKQHNIVCTSIVPGQMVNIHHSYRSALKYWKRRLFDPFRRRSRITVTIDGETLKRHSARQISPCGPTRRVLKRDDQHRCHRSGHEPCVSASETRRRDAKRDGNVHRRGELTQRNTSLCVAYRAPQCIRFSKTD